MRCFLPFCQSKEKLRIEDLKKKFPKEVCKNFLTGLQKAFSREAKVTFQEALQGQDSGLFAASLYRSLFASVTDDDFIVLDPPFYQFLFNLFVGQFESSACYESLEGKERQVWEKNIIRAVIPAVMGPLKEQYRLRIQNARGNEGAAEKDFLQGEYYGASYAIEGISGLFKILFLTGGYPVSSNSAAIGSLLNIEHNGGCLKGFSGKVGGILLDLLTGIFKEASFPNPEGTHKRSYTLAELKKYYLHDIYLKREAPPAVRDDFRGYLSADYHGSLEKFLEKAASTSEKIPLNVQNIPDAYDNTYDRTGLSAAHTIVRIASREFSKVEDISLRVFASAFLGVYGDLLSIKEGNGQDKTLEGVLEGLELSKEEIEKYGTDISRIITDLPFLLLRFHIKNNYLVLSPNYFNQAGFTSFDAEDNEGNQGFVSLIRDERFLPEGVSERLKKIRAYNFGSLLATHFQREFIRKKDLPQEEEKQ